MTLVSVRLRDIDIKQINRWAKRLGVDRSELMRRALERHLAWLQAEEDTAAWLEQPLSAEERELSDVAEWGPAEDWSDWG